MTRHTVHYSWCAMRTARRLAPLWRAVSELSPEEQYVIKCLPAIGQRHLLVLPPAGEPLQGMSHCDERVTNARGANLMGHGKAGCCDGGLVYLQGPTSMPTSHKSNCMLRPQDTRSPHQCLLTPSTNAFLLLLFPSQTANGDPPCTAWPPPCAAWSTSMTPWVASLATSSNPSSS